ncbi:uncharacterized protein LOC127436652 [Myxocyprinus asiaticus]|uniref:uncharacterized protein LOC127436652 n=1 Tax=Myxocyprinus asiaticus TaxID=70543 RepID=UPI002221969C|nr:uncharacterized protein LOC127436652 [Myxocyprinus asiaticus]
MSAEERAPFVVSCNLESPICRDWVRQGKEEKEAKSDQTWKGSSADESEELEPEPPPAAVRRKVSFADAFGLDLVSVKKYDSRDSRGPDLFGLIGTENREGEEYHISCLFTVPASDQELEMRIQKQKLELESIELFPGSTTIQGIIRVLNICFHKAVYVRTTLDSWQSHFDLQAEYMPGSSDGETDRFAFQLMLMPPFQAKWTRVEFCLRYESSAGTFWANNGGTNYIVFCHQRYRGDLKEKEREREKVKEESNHKGIRSCLKTVSKKICTEETHAEASGEISEHVTPSIGHRRESTTEEEAGITPPKSLMDCCKTLVDQRRIRRAARLAHVQDYFSQKAKRETISKSSTMSIPKLNVPSSRDLPIVHILQGNSMDTSPMLLNQIPLLSLDWGGNTTALTQANPTDVCNGTNPENHPVDNQPANSACDTWEAFLSGSDTIHRQKDTQDQQCIPQESVCSHFSQSQSVSNMNEGAEKDTSLSVTTSEPESFYWRAAEILESVPSEQSNDLSSGPSREPVLGYQYVEEPRVTPVTCSAQGSETKRVVRELKRSGDRRTPHHEHTSGHLSQGMSPGEAVPSTFDTDTPNSKVRDGILPEEFTGRFDTSNAEAKVKENIHRAVNDSLTFTGIIDEPFEDRQKVGSLEKKDIDKDRELKMVNDNMGEEKESEEQVETWAFHTELREEEMENTRKDQDEKTLDERKGIKSIPLCIENKLGMLNENWKDNSELQKDDKRHLEAANEGLQMEKTGDKEEEMYSETKQERVEESKVLGENQTDGEGRDDDDFKTCHQPHDTQNTHINTPDHISSYQTVNIDLFEHLSWTTSVKEKEATPLEDDFEFGSTLRNRATHESLDEVDKLPITLPSVHLSWVGGTDSNRRLLSCWQEFCSLGHVYAILFVIFVTAYLYDLPTCLALYLFFSVLLVWKRQETTYGRG